MATPVRPVRARKSLVRAPRVPLDLEVESKTIGTAACYSLVTEDISRSGLLLVWDREARMPFNINTLLELKIDPKGSCLGHPVNCLGKVVRREAYDESGKGNSTRLGIQIVQIDNTDLKEWEGCLAELETRYGIEMSDRVAGAS